MDIPESLTEQAFRATSGDLPSNVPGRILYNLTWVSESDYDNNQPLSQS